MGKCNLAFSELGGAQPETEGTEFEQCACESELTPSGCRDSGVVFQSIGYVLIEAKSEEFDNE